MPNIVRAGLYARKTTIFAPPAGLQANAGKSENPPHPQPARLPTAANFIHNLLKFAACFYKINCKGAGLELIYWILIPIAVAVAILNIALGLRGGPPNRYKRELLRGAQRDFYRTLGPALETLLAAAGRLWDAPNNVNFILFVDALRTAEEAVVRQQALLDTADYLDLKALFADFWQFEAGKKRLAALRERRLALDDVQQNWPVELFVSENAATRRRLVQKTAEIEAKFARLFRGE
jgi:hypothetical protein